MDILKGGRLLNEESIKRKKEVSIGGRGGVKDGGGGTERMSSSRPVGCCCFSQRQKRTQPIIKDVRNCDWFFVLSSCRRQDGQFFHPNV